MEKLEVMRTFYDSARTELIERIQLRDNAAPGSTLVLRQLYSA